MLPARIEAEYKDMVISQLKEEIFELRKNQVHYEKMATMVETLETRCRGFDRDKVVSIDKERICADYDENIKRQKDLIDDLRKKVLRLENANDSLETRCAAKDREILELKKRAEDAESESKKRLKEGLKNGEEATRKEEKLQNTITTLKEAQALLKSAESKITSQQKEITTDKQLINDLKQMNQDLKNKFEGLLSLRRRTERDCALHEGTAIERQKANDNLAHENQSLKKKLDESLEKNEHLKVTIEKV